MCSPTSGPPFRPGEPLVRLRWESVSVGPFDHDDVHICVRKQHGIMLIGRTSGGGPIMRLGDVVRSSVVAGAVVLSGCSSDDTSAGEPTTSKSSVAGAVNVRVQEFAVIPDTTSA